MMDCLKESLICNICQKKFAKERHLKQHYLTHEVLACDICEKKFSHPKNLKKHYQVHTDAKSYQCEVCYRRFGNPKNLNKHFLTHSAKKKSPAKDQLKKHAATPKSQNSFKCDVCLKTFANLDQFEDHLSSHETKKPFKCHLCPSQFIYKKGLVRHCRTHLLKCNKCTQKFYSKVELNRHRSVDHGKNSSTKVSSQKKLSDVKSLRIRNKIVEDDKSRTYECKECKRKYNYPKNFQRHLLVHGDRCFVCDVCGKSYFRKDHLQRHYRLHNGNRSYRCYKCSKRFLNQADLREHRGICNKGKGSISKKNKKTLDSLSDLKPDFSIENSLTPYVVLERLKIYDTEKSIIIPKERRFACNVCGNSFTRRSDLKRHLSRVHAREGKGPVPIKQEENSDFQTHHSSDKPDTDSKKLSKSKYSGIKTEKKSDECDKSKKKYNYKLRLQKYFRMHPAGKSFTCDVCGKVFQKQNSFKIHYLSHFDAKSFVCEVCTKHFCSLYNLKRHAKIHRRNKALVCNVCQKVFDDPKCFKYHCDIFKGKEAYGCSECEKMFHLRQSLSRHVLSAHKNGSIECKECLKTFVDQESLQAHKDILCGKKSPADISDESNPNNKTLDPECLREINNKDNNNVCNICQKSFANARLFKHHLDSYKRKQTYECTKCVKKFHHRQSLTRHLLIHNTEPGEKLANDRDSFSDESSLKEQLDANDRDSFSDESSLNEQLDANDRDSFSDESSLNEQLDPCITELENEINDEDNNNNNICNICQKSFGDSKLLKCHLDTYEGKETYECPECLKKFHSRQSLSKHLLIHEKASFQCDVCHKTFSDPVSLQQHIHVLSGDLSFECNIEDTFSGESIKILIDERLNLNKEPNPCATEKPCVIYVKDEIGD